MSIGTLCLAAGLLLHLFVHAGTPVARDWRDGVTGLLLGLSIGINLVAVRQKARQRKCG